MLYSWLVAGLVATTVATGLVAGVFLTFSDFVMRSLRAAEPAAGMDAMQWINRVVYRSVFMWLLLGIAPVSVLLAIAVMLNTSMDQSAWVLGSAVLYLFGVIAVTRVGNVPMNNALDRMNNNSAHDQEYWTTYLRRWTRLNHVRTVASVLAFGGFLAATIQAVASA